MVYRAFEDYHDEDHAQDESYWFEMSWHRYNDNYCHQEEEYDYDDIPFLCEDLDLDFFLEISCEGIGEAFGFFEEENF